jgi:hypothetical protein
MTKFFETPFAQAGNKTAVPDALQPDGSISYTEGWSPDYELPNTDPDYKPIGREQTNQMFFDITEAMGLVQRQGILFWDTTFAYSQYARVIGSNGQVYKAVIANAGNDPTTDLGTNWVLDSQVVIASQAEAEAGVNNTNVMTPLRTAQARGTTGQWEELVAGQAYMRPDGIIEQYGMTGIINATSYATITLPVTFPNSFIAAFGSVVGDNAADAAGNNGGCSVYVVSNSRFTIGHYNNGSNNNAMYWIAIGR